MEYRGEDASRTRADSRRQPPWQSSGAGPAATRAWDDSTRGYGQDDGYPAADGYGGNPPDDSYGGYEDYGQGAGYGAAQGYGAAGQYGARGGYGYPPGNGYADDNGYPHSDDYAASGGYGDGYGQGTGYADGDGYGTGYGQAGSYGQQAGYGDGRYHDDAYGSGGFGSGPYERPQPGRRPDDTYADGGFGTGPYQRPQAGRRLDDTYADGGFGTGPYQLPRGGGGYQTGGYGRSGGYPALGAGSGSRDDMAGRYGDAGNDWYAGQPAAASGSGFADTGVYSLSARDIEAYGTGPRPAGHGPGDYHQDGYGQHDYDDGYHGGVLPQAAVRDPARGFPPAPGRQPAELEAAAPQGLVYTGQQERYDDGGYHAYPGYGGQHDLDDAPGYSAPGGYEASQGYHDYQEPGAFGAPGYDDYDDADDPYQERYRGDGTGRPPRPGGSGNPGTGGKRGRRLLLLSALAVVVVGVLGAAAYTFLLKPKPAADSSLPSAGPLPTSGSTSAATAACVQKLGEYCHIELRSDDPVPLTLAELFPPAFLNETDHSSFTRIAMRLDKTCSNAVIGQDLINALQSDGCTQVLRASYVSGDNKIMGTIGVVNLATTNEAHYAGKVVGANDFIAPLSTSTGIGAKLGSGTGVVEAEFKGHYLILTWAEFTNGSAPSTGAQDQQLEQFESDLVAGTANISLSQRMVTGAPAPANG